MKGLNDVSYGHFGPPWKISDSVEQFQIVDGHFGPPYEISNALQNYDGGGFIVVVSESTVVLSM